MRVNNVEHGREQYLKIRTAYQAAAVTDKQDVETPLDDLPTELDGCEVRVRSLHVRIPTPTITTTASKTLDAVTLCQLMNYLSLRLCGDSPLAAAGLGDYVFQSIPMNDLFDMFAWYSGRSPLQGLAQDDVLITQLTSTGTEENTFASAFETTNASQRNRGWGQYCGPMGEADNNGGSWSDAVWFEIPLVDDSEPADHGVPAWMLTGKRPNGAKSAPGAIVANMSTSVDANSVSFATDGFDVLAACVLGKPGTKMVPVLPYFRARSFTDSQFRGTKGPVFFSAIQKALTAGAQTATAITTMHQRLAGQLIGDPDGNVSRWHRYLAARVRGYGEARKGFLVTSSQAAITTGANKARLFRPPVYNQLHWGSKLSAPGSMDEGIEYDVVSATDTTYRLLEGIYVPTDGQFTGKVQEAVGDGKVMVSSKNGNLLPNTNPKAAALPKLILGGK